MLQRAPTTTACAALLSILGLLGMPPAHADGPTALQLQGLLASAPSSGPVPVIAGRDISAAISTLAGGSTPRPLSTRQAERPSVLDYGVKGGGIQTIVLQGQSVGSTGITISGTTPINLGQLVTSSLLPVGTTATAIGTAISAVATYTTSGATTPLGTASLGTALVFASAFSVPAGAAITGTGIPSGATVWRADTAAASTTVYMSVPTVSGVASGTAVSFSYASVPVTLSAGWTVAVPAGTAIGIVSQDDGPALQTAFLRANAGNGGPGNVFIPSGGYYATTTPSTSDGLVVETGANVVLLPGTSPIAAFKGFSTNYAARTIASTAQNLVATTLNIDQSLFQQPTPTAQVQAEMISQTNVGCINDGSSYGCGMVGQDIQQSMSPSITSGVMWAYHVTDYLAPGQNVAWVGAELELNNQSGNDQPKMAGQATTNGIHLDDIGSTPLTMGIYFGGSSNGYWHTGMGCPDNAVHDYCVQVITGASSTVLAGIDMKGNITAQTVQAAGSVVSTQSGAYIVSASDCGTTIRNSASAAVTWVVPAGLATGCALSVIQAGTGQITFSGGTGETMDSLNGASKTSGRYALATIIVDTTTSFELAGQVQ